MRPGCRRLALAVVVAFLVFSLGCNHRVKQLAPQTISLSYNNGNCTQNGGTAVVELDPTGSVTYQSATAVGQFQVQFTTCPFASCPITSSNGSPANAGQPKSGTAGNTYYYSSITIGNQPCNGLGAMGVRIRPQ